MYIYITPTATVLVNIVLKLRSGAHRSGTLQLGNLNLIFLICSLQTIRLKWAPSFTASSIRTLSRSVSAAVTDECLGELINFFVHLVRKVPQVRQPSAKTTLLLTAWKSGTETWKQKSYFRKKHPVSQGSLEYWSSGRHCLFPVNENTGWSRPISLSSI